MNTIFKIRFLIIGLIFFISTACNQKNIHYNIEEITAEGNIDGKIPSDMYPSNKVTIRTHTDFAKTHYPERILEFKKNPLSKDDIVFLGNSITEQAGNWAVRVNNPKVKNRGIAGDTTDGVLARLGEIIYCKPKQVFLLIGINDLFRDDMTSELVFNNIMKIVNQIHEKSPKTMIYVNTILPTSTEKIKEKIKNTNTMIANSQLKEPYEIILLHDEFATQQDLMNMELSDDGVHLNEKGYNVWVKKTINLIQ